MRRLRCFLESRNVSVGGTLRFMSEYRTIKCKAQEEFTEKRSRFIGWACPVSCEDEAIEFINSIRAQYRDATHNVYAYVLRHSNISRHSDDGEPQGTAGIPVLEVIKKSELVNTAVVITRYFGGVMLGAGGLVRAYSHSAALVIKSAGIVRMMLCCICEFCCDYSLYGKLEAVVPENGGAIDECEFLDTVRVRLHVVKGDFGRLAAKLSEVSLGGIVLTSISEDFFPL